MKIIKARITQRREKPDIRIPQVFIILDDGTPEQFLFEYYPDEISFTENEFIGLTIDEAYHLKFIKDKQYFQS